MRRFGAIAPDSRHSLRGAVPDMTFVSHDIESPSSPHEGLGE
jgi:hypothetical protein